MKAISGNLEGTVGSRYITDIVTSGGGSASSPSVIAYNYKSLLGTAFKDRRLRVESEHIPADNRCQLLAKPTGKASEVIGLLVMTWWESSAHL